MTGRISITALSSVKKKELYFKALDVLETTHNSIKLSYLTNLDKPVNSINTRNIEKNGTTSSRNWVWNRCWRA